MAGKGLNLCQHRVESAAGAQAYLTAGPGSGIPLVLLHGLGASSLTWAPVLEGLAGRWPVVLPDLAGHGASEPVTGTITFGHLVTGLDAVVREACAEKCVLVGHSLGAWLACLYALAHPSRVERVVLVNGPILTELPEGLTLRPKTREEAARLFQATRPGHPAGFDDAMLDNYVEYVRNGPVSRFPEEEAAAATRQIARRLEEFPRPVTVIWGMEDRLVPFTNAERLVSGFPEAELTRLPGCGHGPHVDAPERFASALGVALQSGVGLARR